jgi:hypothetical protein
MVDAIRARCRRRDDPESMRINELEVVARDGIEPSTRGFSDVFARRPGKLDKT